MMEAPLEWLDHWVAAGGWVDPLTATLAAFVFGQVLAWTYDFTFEGLSYSRGFGHTVVLVCLSAAILVLRRSRPSRFTTVARQAATEFTILASLYAVWRMARKLPLYQSAGARQRALDIVDVQEALFLPNELALQELVMRWLTSTARWDPASRESSFWTSPRCAARIAAT